MIRHLCSGPTRAALLGLDPRSRIWLSVEGEPLLFERTDGKAEEAGSRTMTPVGESVAAWHRLTSATPTVALDIDFTERPADAGAAADKWWTVDERAARGLNR